MQKQPGAHQIRVIATGLRQGETMQTV